MCTNPDIRAYITRREVARVSEVATSTREKEDDVDHREDVL